MTSCRRVLGAVVHPPDAWHVVGKRERGDLRKADVLARHELASRDGGVARGRRLGAGAQPVVQIDEQRPQDPSLFGEVERVSGLLRRGRQRARRMRCSRQEVEARGRGQRHIGCAVFVRVRQRSGARPVLGGGERVEDARHDGSRGGSGQESLVRERGHVHRPQDRQHGVAGLSRACKPVIEAAATGAGRRDHQAVECRAAALVLVEAVAHELAEEAPALRVTESDDALHQRRVVAQRRGGPLRT